MRRGFFILLVICGLGGAAAAEDPPGAPGFTLNFQNADIDTVLRFFSEALGVIFVKSESVRGFVTVTAPARVTPTEALEVLRAVLDVRGFSLVGGPGRMMKVLSAAEALQSGVEVADGPAESIEGGDRLMTHVLPLRYMPAAEIKAHLAPLLSRGGNLIADDRMNRLVITDVASNIRRLAKIVRGLDVRSPQVLIEALIVEVSLTKETKLGIEWSHVGRFTAEGRSFTDEASQSFDVAGFVTEGLKYAVVRSDGQLRGLLHALATDKNVNILSTPHVLTVNNQAALIRVGEEVPVLTQTRNIQGGETIRSFDFKQVAIELEVTPRINDDREVFLKVHPLVKKILGFNTELNAPILATREALTSVQVKDGQTVVIGGLMKDDRTINQSKVPLLADIPLLGLLFKKRGATKEKTELLVFITPRVIVDPDEAREVTVLKEEESRAKRTPHRRSSRALYEEGRRFYRAKRFEEAAAALEEAEMSAPEPAMRRRAAALLEKAKRRMDP